MNNLKKLFIVFLLLVTAAFSVNTAYAKAYTDSGSAISRSDEYTPLYTTSPDSTLKDYSAYSPQVANYQLFYTQTTFLALAAGYLIIFKVKCIPKAERRHRKRL